MHPDQFTQVSGETPRRREKVGYQAMTVSLLVHAVIVLLAIFVFIKWVYPPQPPPPDFAPGGGGGGNEGQQVKVQSQARRAIASTESKRVAISGESSFVLPDVSDSPMDASLPVVTADAGKGSGGGSGGGNGGGNGSGNGLGTGPGSGIGKGFAAKLNLNPFGSNENSSGALEGHLYDFKQDEKGQAVKYDISHPEDFNTRVIKLDEGRFKDAAFKKYFKAPDTLYLTHLAIKTSPASGGPGYFGAAGKVQPSGWVAHYHGMIKAPKDMSFRFVGIGDDYLFVRSKGRVRLCACAPDIEATVAGKWQQEDTNEPWPSPINTNDGWKLVKGEYMTVKKDETMDIDIAVGERPGGYVGFVLMVQEKGVTYRSANGCLALPLFTVQPFTPEEQQHIQDDFPNWQFDWDNVPNFGAPTATNPFR